MKLLCITGLAMILASFSGMAIAAQQGDTGSAKPTKSVPGSAAKAKSAATREADGERVFEENCARCHTPPDAFSPRISGAIVRHMRVRASLSKQEEEALLRFFNP